MNRSHPHSFCAVVVLLRPRLAVVGTRAGRGAGRANTCKGSPFSHLNLRFPVVKCSHGNGGKLSPFLSPSEPCPAKPHNTRVGTTPAAVLKVPCFLKTLLFVCAVVAMLSASRLPCSASSRGLLPYAKPGAGTAQITGRARS